MKRLVLLAVIGAMGLVSAGHANAATTAKMTLSASIVEDTLTLSVVSSPKLGKIALPSTTFPASDNHMMRTDGQIWHDVSANSPSITSFGGYNNGKVKAVSTTPDASYELTQIASTPLASGTVAFADNPCPNATPCTMEGMEKTNEIVVSVWWAGGSNPDETDTAGSLTLGAIAH